MTNVICHWTMFDHRTLNAIFAYAPQTKLIEGKPHDMQSYTRTLKEYWTGDEDLIVIEPDMGITADTVSSLSACGEHWCSFGYLVWWADNHTQGYDTPFKRTIHSLGATKFSAYLQREFPATEWDDLFDRCTKECAGGWWHLDSHLAYGLTQRDLHPHDHGDIAHYHDYGPVSISPDIKPLEENHYSGNREQLLAILRSRGWANPERMSVFDEPGTSTGTEPAASA